MKKTLFIALLACVKLNASAQCWEKVSAAISHTIAIKTDGTLWGWGSASDLGNGLPNQPVYTLPVQIGTETDWAEISAGGNFSLAIKKDGSLWIWGSHPNAALGGNDTSFLTAYSPVQIGSDYNWAKISAGGAHVLALKTDNTLWAWGMANLGQVGNGLSSCFFCPPVYQKTPIQIGTDHDWSQISACSNFSLAIKNNGTLWCWGDNEASFVNNGQFINNIPTQIGTDTTWRQIEGGEYPHAVALKTDGTLWNWGLDIRTETPFIIIPTPLQVGTATNWVKIAAGVDHDIAIKSDGTVWSWGRNAGGQMGNGNTNLQPLPQMIHPALNNNFTEISGGYLFTMAIKSDGTLWGGGSNTTGNVGNGTITNQYTPALVNCSVVDVQDITNADVITVYPNPATDHFTIVANEKTIGSVFYLTNSLGQLIYSNTINSIETVVQTGNFAEGIYYLHGDKIGWQKLMFLHK
jgi:alpha-tubulin suppressor-like RCC1 family protein